MEREDVERILESLHRREAKTEDKRRKHERTLYFAKIVLKKPINGFEAGTEFYIEFVHPNPYDLSYTINLSNYFEDATRFTNLESVKNSVTKENIEGCNKWLFKEDYVIKIIEEVDIRRLKILEVISTYNKRR